MHISIFFGGSTEERGISINSARAAFEMLQNLSLEIHLFYVSPENNIYEITENNIYSNTPDDFAFILDPIDNFWSDFSTNFAIPLIHGPFGEDGQIQRLFEEKKIPFLFSDSQHLANMFLKDKFCNFLWQRQFPTWDSFLFNGDYERLQQIHKQHKEIILKPNDGGSSCFVFISRNLEESLEILKKYPNLNFIIEEKHIGKEFSISVINHKAFIPVEIDMGHQIFDHHSKYFPSEKSLIKTPPDFSMDQITKIQRDSEYIFNIIQAQDCVRIDGWILDNGNIIYTECNPIPSIEFNGIFWQSVPFLPQDIFLQIVNHKLQKYNLTNISRRIEVTSDMPIIFGGERERDVSFLSGQNTSVCLYNLNKYKLISGFLKENYIYQIPLHMIFKHSLRDLWHNIENIDFYNQICKTTYQIIKLPLNDFLNAYVFVFIALHGGFGENGSLQKILEDKKIKFNGSNSKISQLCMNKHQTIQFLEKELKEIKSIHRNLIDINKDIPKIIENQFYILKPNEDGCSLGVVKISKQIELEQYILALKNKQQDVTINNKQVKLPSPQLLLLEEYIQVDEVSVRSINHETLVEYKKKTGWIELTVGVLNYEVFQPSITVFSGDILTAEEKFQKGLGINLTPPPSFLLSSDQIQILQSIILKICKILQLNTYARLDVFFNRLTNEFILIEINTLPALTFATVLFQQAILSGYRPEILLKKIIKLGMCNDEKAVFAG